MAPCTDFVFVSICLSMERLFQEADDNEQVVLIGNEVESRI
jgi:hypothetical protein